MPDVSLDAESAEWVEALSSPGPRREEALGRLHELLLRAARFEVARRTGLGHDLDDLATQAATDAMMAITAKLERLLGPDGPELTCEECFEELDRYVDLELAGREADAAIPGMRAHLTGCAACHEEHDSLAALVVSERPD